MEKGIKNKINLINDVSGLEFDNNSIQILKKYKTPFVLQHSQGNPQTMQKNPKYKNVLLDIQFIVVLIIIIFCLLSF